MRWGSRHVLEFAACAGVCGMCWGSWHVRRLAVCAEVHSMRGGNRISIRRI